MRKTFKTVNVNLMLMLIYGTFFIKHLRNENILGSLSTFRRSGLNFLDF